MLNNVLRIIVIFLDWVAIIAHKTPYKVSQELRNEVYNRDIDAINIRVDKLLTKTRNLERRKNSTS